VDFGLLGSFLFFLNKASFLFLEEQLFSFNVCGGKFFLLVLLCANKVIA